MLQQETKYIVSVIISLCHIMCCGQDIINTHPQTIGAAGILSVTATDGVASVNPSTMANVKHFTTEFAYTIPFSLPELGQKNAKFVIPTKPFHITGQVTSSGDETSKYTQYGGGISHDFNHWAIGMEYYGITHTMSDNQKYTSSYSRIGLHFYPDEKWLLSVCVHNIERRVIDYEYSTFDIEPVALFALRWRANQLFAMLAEAEKRLEHDVVGKVGAAIYPTKRMDMTIGFSTRGQSLSAGIGLTGRVIGFHVGIMHHEQLGVTSGASINFTFGDREK